MAASFKEVFEEINTVLAAGEIDVDGEMVQLEFFLGGDYKVQRKVCTRIYSL